MTRGVEKNKNKINAPDAMFKLRVAFSQKHPNRTTDVMKIVKYFRIGKLHVVVTLRQQRTV